MKSTLIAAALLFIALFSAAAQPHPEDKGYNFVQNVSYTSADEQDDYRKERCVLDIYYPENDKDFKTIVWFHGGGLTGGSKELPEYLKNKGVCIVGVNYRLSPHVGAPSYIEDAAAAVAWVFKNIEDSRYLKIRLLNLKTQARHTIAVLVKSILKSIRK